MTLPTFVQDIQKGHLEPIVTLLGILSTFTAAARALADFASNRTLTRKRQSASEDVTKSLEVIRKLAEVSEGRDAENFSLYEQEMRDNLERSLKTLKYLQEKQHALDNQKFREPTRAERHLLLYRPLNFDGLLAQTCFYALIALVVVFLVRWAFRVGTISDPSGAFGVFLVGIYLSEAANRIRHVAAFAKKESAFLDLGLTGARKNLLCFGQKTGNAFLDRAFYYLAGLFFFAVVLAFSLDPTHFNPADFELATVILLLCAVVMRVARADALAARAGELYPGAKLPDPPGKKINPNQSE
jgi:hypothetical protein